MMTMFLQSLQKHKAVGEQRMEKICCGSIFYSRWPDTLR